MWSLISDVILFLPFVFQLQRPRERLCLFVLLVIPLSLRYNEMACRSPLLMACWRSFAGRPRPFSKVTETLAHALFFKLSTSSCQDTHAPGPPPPHLYQLHLSLLVFNGTSTVKYFMFLLSMKTKKTLWITETFYWAQWLEHPRAFFPFAEQRGGVKNAVWKPEWCRVCSATKLILLEYWYLHPCVAV